MTPIASAVEPIRVCAVQHAREAASELVNRVLARYEADPTIVKFKPDMTRRERASHDNLVTLIRSLTTVDSGKFVRNEEKVSAFIADSCERASGQYTAFVSKLESKVGEHLSATLTGNHVWGYSILTVTKLDGSVERWSTQQIINVSVLGKLFHQWPSRKMK